MARFVFLGTSAGTPTPERNVSSLAVQPLSSRHWWLVDCGEGTQRQILKSPLSLAKISHIFITHLHGDHVLGLPGLLASRSLSDGNRPLSVYGPLGLEAFLREALRATYSNLRFKLSVHEFPLAQSTSWSVPGFAVTALPLRHNVPSFAFLWQEEEEKRPFQAEKAKELGIPPGPLYGRLRAGEEIELADGRRFAGAAFLGQPLPRLRFIVAGDNASPELLHGPLAGTQLLIHEATYCEADFQALRRAQLHSTARRVGEAAAAAGLPNLILTHFSPRYKSRAALDPLIEEARAVYGGHLELADDFADFELTRSAELRRLPATAAPGGVLPLFSSLGSPCA